ncbi:MAG: hypothetical protein ACTS77_01085 [Arsenophonus sp. NC-TX2-MAG3]
MYFFFLNFNWYERNVWDIFGVIFNTIQISTVITANDLVRRFII